MFGSIGVVSGTSNTESVFIAAWIFFLAPSLNRTHGALGGRGLTGKPGFKYEKEDFNTSALVSLLGFILMQNFFGTSISQDAWVRTEHVVHVEHNVAP